MRASRLLSIVLLLQNRGRMSARELATELEVSPRTVYRGVEALSATGIPITSDRGPRGGFQLLEGYRTRLTGLTGSAAEALLFAGMPEPAAELGLGMDLGTARLKLLAALPEEARSRTERVRERFHLDPSGWFRDVEPTPFLPVVARAVWEQSAIRVRYRRWPGETEAVLHPLGVVLKAGQWYVVAQAPSRNELRTVRVSRILALEPLGERFERPAGFDLDAYWRQWSDQLESGLYRTEALIRLSPRALDAVPHFLEPVPAKAVRASAGPPDATGWREAVLPIEGIDHAVLTLLRFGAEVEVIAPPPLRQAMRQMTTEMAAIYAPPASAHVMLEADGTAGSAVTSPRAKAVSHPS